MTIPAAPGTTPVPNGYVRLYHYTGADPDQIRQEGLRMQYAKGESYGEPNQIWASTKWPDASSRYNPVVEFSVPYNDPRFVIGRHDPWRDPAEHIQHLYDAGSHVTFGGDIDPSEITAVHEPWHHNYRYFQENDLDPDEYQWIHEKADQFPHEHRALTEYEKTFGGQRRHSMAFPGEGWYWHVSPSRYRDSIQRHGLDYSTQGGEDWSPHGWSGVRGNFLTRSRGLAATQSLYAGEPYDVWAVNTDGLTLTGDKNDTVWREEGGPEAEATWVYTQEPIGPERLELWNDSKGDPEFAYLDDDRVYATQKWYTEPPEHNRPDHDYEVGDHVILMVDDTGHGGLPNQKNWKGQEGLVTEVFDDGWIAVRIGDERMPELFTAAEIMPAPGVSGEAWPDTLPWDESGNEYYRNASWKLARTTMFHISPHGRRESIFIHGLIGDNPDVANSPWPTTRAGVYLWDTIQNARLYGGRAMRIADPDIWAVDVTGLNLQEDPYFDRANSDMNLREDWYGPHKTPGAFVTYDNVPPDRIHLVEPNSWYPEPSSKDYWNDETEQFEGRPALISRDLSFDNIFQWRVPFIAIPSGEYEVGWPGEEHYDIPEGRWLRKKAPDQYFGDLQGHVIFHPEYGEIPQWPQWMGHSMADEDKKAEILNHARAQYDSVEGLPPRTAAYEDRHLMDHGTEIFGRVPFLVNMDGDYRMGYPGEHHDQVFDLHRDDEGFVGNHEGMYTFGQGEVNVLYDKEKNSIIDSRVNWPFNQFYEKRPTDEELHQTAFERFHEMMSDPARTSASVHRMKLMIQLLYKKLEETANDAAKLEILQKIEEIEDQIKTRPYASWRLARTTLYHVTDAKNRQSIQIHGLDPNRSELWEDANYPYTWFTDDKQRALDIADGVHTPYGADIWTVDGTGLHLQPDPHGSYPGAFASQDRIPPDKMLGVEHYEGGGDTNRLRNEWFGFKPMGSTWKFAVSAIPADYSNPADPLDLQGKQPVFENMHVDWMDLPDAEQMQAVVNAFRATMLSPRLKLRDNAIMYQEMMEIPANESDPDVFEQHARAVKERWDRQGQGDLMNEVEPMGWEQQVPGKLTPGFWTNIRRLAALGPYADQLRDAAVVDMSEFNGSGQYFRDTVLKLGIPGVGPKVASFAWLALNPKGSQLATLDVWMMRHLQQDQESPNSPSHYFDLEDQLRDEKDALYDPQTPLGQYQWGVWDKLRTPGFHQDHSPLRVHNPTPYTDVSWGAFQRAPRPQRLPEQHPEQEQLFAKTADIRVVPGGDYLDSRDGTLQEGDDANVAVQAWDGDKMIASAWVEPQDDQVWVWQVWVDPQYRNSGVAKQLLQTIKDEFDLPIAGWRDKSRREVREPTATRMAKTATVMYHISPPHNRESILEHGINYEKSDPRGRLYGQGEYWPAGNYLFTTYNQADLGSEDDIYEVNVDGLDLQPDPYLDMDNDHARLVTEPIPRERIRLIRPSALTPDHPGWKPHWERNEAS
jgi:GNAT superfamily N-acetyltransferase